MQGDIGAPEQAEGDEGAAAVDWDDDDGGGGYDDGGGFDALDLMHGKRLIVCVSHKLYLWRPQRRHHEEVTQLQTCKHFILNIQAHTQYLFTHTLQHTYVGAHQGVSPWTGDTAENGGGETAMKTFTYAHIHTRIHSYTHIHRRGSPPRSGTLDRRHCRKWGRG